jgi:hypothetical protein
MNAVVGTCRRLGLDPFAYLRNDFARPPALAADWIGEFPPASTVLHFPKTG